MRPLVIVGSCVLLFGCATEPVQTARNVTSQESSSFDPVPWRWQDYSNRVWIAVNGVGVENTRTKTNNLKKFSFSYSPNTGKFPAEAIAIRSFDMFSGDKAERLLLKVLFGMEGNWLSNSNAVLNGKAFHIYTFKTLAGTPGSAGSTNTIYFDATQYHNQF